MIGAGEFQHLGEVMGKLQETAQAGGQPDPELVPACRSAACSCGC